MVAVGTGSPFLAVRGAASVGLAVGRRVEGPAVVEAMRVAVGVVGDWRVPLRQLEVADVKAVRRAQGNAGLIGNL